MPCVGVSTAQGLYSGGIGEGSGLKLAVKVLLTNQRLSVSQ